jgi:hypothetical protein
LTKLRFSTTVHPQIDSLVETENGTIQTFLRAYIVHNLQQWDRHLALAEFMYNAIKYYITRISSFKVDMGYLSRLPLDIITHTASRDASQIDYSLANAESFV